MLRNGKLMVGPSVQREWRSRKLRSTHDIKGLAKPLSTGGETQAGVCGVVRPCSYSGDVPSVEEGCICLFPWRSQNEPLKWNEKLLTPFNYDIDHFPWSSKAPHL